MSEPRCIFCELIAGRAPVSVVADEQHAVAFLDAFPVAPGHVLITPRRHVERLADLTSQEGTAMFALAQRLAASICDQLAPAVNLHLSDGAEADQDVPHVHLHVIPRHAGDQVVMELPGDRVTREELERVAVLLRA